LTAGIVPEMAGASGQIAFKEIRKSRFNFTRG
jgi:hypothetical protein